MVIYSRPDPTTECPTMIPITTADFNRCVMENVPALGGEIDIAEKHVCEYCPGLTFDDSRGHCCACGAPRRIKSYKPFLRTYMGEPITDISRWVGILGTWQTLG